MSFIDFLPIVTPDYYDVYLTKSANFDIPRPGAYKQVLNNTDGGNPKVVTLKSTPNAMVTLKFTGLDQNEADDLSDYYYNPLKAYGMARSYVWQDPQTLELFTVQNISAFSETATIMSYGKYDISFTAKILGIPGLAVITSGSTINFKYGGTATFITKYSDDTESLLIDPPLKDFGSSADRETLIMASDPLLVTELYLYNNDVTSLASVSTYVALTYLYLTSTLITEPPDISDNIALQRLYLNSVSITEAPDVSNNINLIRLDLHDCNITEESLSACVDQLYVNRVALGGNPCNIKLNDNNGLTADAIAKIDGTGTYVGDGLVDNGCTVTY